MRYVEFKEVKMFPVEGNPNAVQMAYKKTLINADLVGRVSPAAIPSEIAGPGNTPIAKPAAAIHLLGERIMVDCTEEMALWKLANESVEIKKPETKEVTEESNIIVS